MPPYRVALTQHVAAHQVPVGQPMPAPIAVAVEDPRVPAVRLAAAGPSWMPVAAPRRRPRPLPPAIPRGGPPHHQTQVGVDRGQHRRHRRGGRTCPHIAWADQDDEIGGIQRCLGGIGQTTWKIADHGDSPTSAGVDHGVHRPGV